MIMNEDKIEEAANKYALNRIDDSYKSYSEHRQLSASTFNGEDVSEAFVVGANWALENQWHDVDEILPKRRSIVLVMLESGDCDLCYFNEYDRFCARINQSLKVKYWMAIPSLPEN